MAQDPSPDCHGTNRVLISVNLKAGRRSPSQLVARLKSLLEECRLEVHVRSDLDEVGALANDWQKEGSLRALVGIGGDGTAKELVNRTIEGVPITLLACGTANLLAKHTHLCSRPERLCRTIVGGKRMRLDVGTAGDQLFLAMLGCGLDAAVVQRMQQRRAVFDEGHISYLSYLKPILDSLRSYDYPAIRLYAEQDNWVDPLVAKWAFILNLPNYGWGVQLAPGATPDDGLLDLCAFERGSVWAGLRYAAAAQVGVHERMPDCILQRGRRFRIESDQLVPYQLDGDPGGVLPVDVEVLPGRLTLLVPASHAATPWDCDAGNG